MRAESDAVQRSRCNLAGSVIWSEAGLPAHDAEFRPSKVSRDVDSGVPASGSDMSAVIVRARSGALQGRGALCQGRTPLRHKRMRCPDDC
eukprot:2991191-Rhodomonas_salina.2